MRFDSHRMKLDHESEIKEDFDFQFETEVIPKLITQHVKFNISVNYEIIFLVKSSQKPIKSESNL